MSTPQRYALTPLDPRTQRLLLNDYASTPPTYTNDLPPSYREHRYSPRCEEDVRNPAPSYLSTIAGTSGADQLADWLVVQTRRMRRMLAESRQKHPDIPFNQHGNSYYSTAAPSYSA